MFFKSTAIASQDDPDSFRAPVAIRLAINGPNQGGGRSCHILLQGTD